MENGGIRAQCHEALTEKRDISLRLNLTADPNHSPAPREHKPHSELKVN